MFTLKFKQPFYYLLKKRYFLWCIPYWDTLDYDTSLDVIESKYKKLHETNYNYNRNKQRR